MKTSTDYPARETIAIDLFGLYARMHEAADRVRDSEPEQAAQRDLQASQIRLMYALTREGGSLELATAWVDAAHALIAAYDRIDLEAIHAERARRHDARAERIATEDRRVAL